MLANESMVLVKLWLHVGRDRFACPPWAASYEDAAAILNIPVGTIRSRLSRGRDALRQLMGMEAKSTSAAALRNITANRSANAPLAQAA